VEVAVFNFVNLVPFMVCKMRRYRYVMDEGRTATSRMVLPHLPEGVNAQDWKRRMCVVCDHKYQPDVDVIEAAAMKRLMHLILNTT